MKLLRLLARVPAWLVDPTAVVLYIISWPFTRRDRQVIVSNACKVLGLKPGEGATFSRKVLSLQFKVYWDTLRYVFFPERIVVEGRTDFDEAFAEVRQSPGGFVVITAHLGAWELAGHFCSLASQRPLHVLAKPSKTKWVNPVLNQMRELLGMQVLWTDSRALFRDMLKVLDRGEGVGFVMDQRPAFKQGGQPVIFLGVPETPIVTGPALVITKKNLPVLGAYCVRVGRSRYRIVPSKILPRDHGIGSIEEVCKVLANDMEKMILAYPEQWAWNYRRWKHQGIINTRF